MAVAGAGALAVALAACGGSSDSSGGTHQRDGGAGSPWILGTTDTVTALDPAGSYDLGSSTLEYNLYQTLVTVPPNSTKIVGDAAKSCTYDDPTTLTCTLNPGEKFSNGDALTSSDVKYSFERAIKIAGRQRRRDLPARQHHRHRQGRHGTLNKGAIETPDDPTVVFHLNQPDTTFQYVLTYPGAAAIVDEDVFPADKKLADDTDHRLRPLQAEPVQGRRAGRARAQLELHGHRTRARRRRSSSSTTPSRRALKLAVQNGEVDVAWRSLSPTDITALKKRQQRHGATRQGLRDPLLGLELNSGVGKQLADPPGRGADHRP